jgi:VWFA-related protein
MGTLQLFTTDKRLLHAAAERVRWNVVGRGGVDVFTPIEKSFSSPVPRGMGAASLDSTTAESHSTADAHVPDKHDSIEGLRDSIVTAGSLGTLEVAVRSLQRLPGRKSVVFFSDGLDLSDMMGEPRVYGAVSRLMNSANRAGVVLYSIDTRGLMILSARAEDADQDRGAIEERHSSAISTQNGLRYLSEQTGAFAVINNNDMNLGLQRIMNDQQGYYLLGYVATDKSVRSWDPDQLKVRVKRSGLKVRWRRGAFGPADAASPADAPEDSLVTAALSPFNAGAMTLRVTAMFGHTPATGSYVHALFFVDINDVKFAHRVDDDVYTGEVELLVVAVNESGQRVKAWRKIEPMTLHAADYEAARKRGITFDTAVSLKDPGGYQIRAAVRDTTTGNVGSSSQFVLVPKVGSGQLAISSVLMKGEQTTESEAREQPAVRIFTSGTNVTYAYEIYTGLKNEEPLSTSITLLRDGQPIYNSPAKPIANADTSGSTGTGVKGLHVIPIGGTLTLGRDLQPGAYALQVNVTRDRAKPKDKARAVAQWVDFEIR